jgi:hypothetical protein
MFLIIREHIVEFQLEFVVSVQSEECITPRSHNMNIVKRDVLVHRKLIP